MNATDDTRDTHDTHDRRTAPPPCTHRPPCPGCPRYGRSDPPPVAHALLTRVAAGSGLPAPVLVRGAAGGFRHRARLAVRGRARSPKIGLFQEASHRIVDTPQCRVHHALINDVASTLRQCIRATNTPPYADRPHTGALRYLQVVVERVSQRAQVVLVGNADTPAPLAPLLAALRDALGNALHSLWWNGNPARGNAILGPHWEHIAGPAAVCEVMGGASVFHPPGAFGQSHLELAGKLVQRAHEWVPSGAVVAELYAGCGALGLGLLERAREVRFNEIAEDSLRGLALGLDAQPAERRARAHVAAGPAADALSILDGADVVLVDPPRRGLDAPVLAALAQRPPQRLVYVACGADSFARDTEVLLAGGRLRLTAIETFAFFPYTEHIETLARFDAT